MTTTFVLWLFLQGGQMAAIPGFRSQANCQEVGAWYEQESQRGDRKLNFRCGPGPDSPMLQLPFPLGRR